MLLQVGLSGSKPPPPTSGPSPTHPFISPAAALLPASPPHHGPAGAAGEVVHASSSEWAEAPAAAPLPLLLRGQGAEAEQEEEASANSAHRLASNQATPPPTWPPTCPFTSPPAHLSHLPSATHLLSCFSTCLPNSLASHLAARPATSPPTRPPACPAAPSSCQPSRWPDSPPKPAWSLCQGANYFAECRPELVCTC